MSESKRIADQERDALELQLRATVLSIPQENRDRLLYACGVAAGRRQARRMVPHWVTAAAAVGIFAGGLTVGSLGFPSATAPTRDMVAAPWNQADTNSRDSKTAVIADDAKPTADVHESQGRSSPRKETGQLTAGIRLEQALALIDGPVPAVEFRGESQDGVHRAPLRAAAAYLR